MGYTTQMDAARQGIETKEMEAVAAQEQMPLERLMELVAKGQVVIPANKRHQSLSPCGIGSALKTKINVNLGTSRDCLDLDVEMQKVKSAVDMGAEAIMDLSSFGDTRTFRRKLVAECPAILGTVPIYDAIVYYNKPLAEITAREWLDVFKMHAEDGVDFMTIHCGLNRATAARFKQNPRRMNLVSRGGSLIFSWMELTGQENPFYEYFDELLEICRTYDVTLSLGDACRPGCIEDAGDISQIEELVALGELTARAWKRDVQVMVEGPGHMPLSQIQANMQIQQSICKGAPFYVLGPWSPTLRRIRPHHLGHRRGDRGHLWRFVPLLCHPGRAPAPAHAGGCAGGDHRLEDRGARGRPCKGSAGRLGLGPRDGQSPPRTRLGASVRAGHRPRKGAPLSRRVAARMQRQLHHVR